MASGKKIITSVSMANGKTLVVGLGNPILGDDGIGWIVANRVEQEIDDPSVKVECVSVGGMRLMEQLVGYDRAIIIDAFVTGKNQPGTLYQFPLEEIPNPTDGHTTSVHDTSLQTALQMGRDMGIHLPKQVQVIGVESLNVLDYYIQ